jgi:predicted metal-dependent enzyme (double-stranded beta helix superfamily)
MAAPLPAPAPAPPRRPPVDLGEEELRAIVADLARRPELWREHVAHDPDQRRFTRLRIDADVEVWLICWMAGQDTGLHDHGDSRGAVAVVAGHIHEERHVHRALAHELEFAAGQTLTFSPPVVHRVRHSGEAPAVTLHAYSPPLRGSSAYAIDEAGRWRSVALGEDDELQPLDPAALP